MIQPTKTFYAGRFRFELPKSISITVQTSRVRGVRIAEVSLPPSATAEEARAAFWKEHVRKLHAITREDELPTVIEEADLGPGLPAVLYRDEEGIDRVLECLLAEGLRGVLLSLSWRQHWEPAMVQAFDDENQRVFRQVVEAFRFLPPGHNAPSPDWYYVPSGAVALPPAQSEEPGSAEYLYLNFVDAGADLRISFDADHPWTPDDADKPKLLERAAKVLTEWSIGARTLRSGPRAVAGFKGEEVIHQVNEEQKLSLAWVFEPESGSQGFRPKIVMESYSKLAAVDAKVAVWDQLLDGIHRLSNR